MDIARKWTDCHFLGIDVIPILFFVAKFIRHDSQPSTINRFGSANIITQSTFVKSGHHAGHHVFFEFP